MSRIVITRRAGETLYIGDDVAVQLVRIRGGHAELVITAPRTTQVDREEKVPLDDARRNAGDRKWWQPEGPS